MSALTPSPCHRCGSEPVVDDAGGVVFVALCRECYDGAEDGCREHSEGATAEAAVERWNDEQADRLAETVAPCPFCGGSDTGVPSGTPPCFVRCGSCSAEGPTRGERLRPLSAAGAVAAWNRAFRQEVSS